MLLYHSLGYTTCYKSFSHILLLFMHPPSLITPSISSEIYQCCLMCILEVKNVLNHLVRSPVSVSWCWLGLQYQYLGILIIITIQRQWESTILQTVFINNIWWFGEMVLLYYAFLTFHIFMNIVPLSPMPRWGYYYWFITIIIIIPSMPPKYQ